MGNETSFKSFPAHVHNLLTITLAETHVVHSKIYPRYRSRRHIEFARDEFSNWLCPHENDNTDIILAGHSMGGILAAEVALLYPYSATSNEAFRHRILGVLAFDTPFLGMHPGVIGTGIASLFQPKPAELQETNDRISPNHGYPLTLTSSEDTSNMFGTPANDPNFNPNFMNDKHIIDRHGWEKPAYFIYKHSDGLTKATKQYFMSHLEFGGCLADYPALRQRYSRIRALEDVDELKGQRDSNGKKLRRVRFVNYYSASTGRAKPPKIARGDPTIPSQGLEVEMKELNMKDRQDYHDVPPSTSPRISVEAPTDEVSLAENMDREVETPLQSIDPEPYHSDDHAIIARQDDEAASSGAEHSNPLKVSEETFLSPSIPDVIQSPDPFDAGLYSTSDALKTARNDHKKAVKEYEKALKSREKAEQKLSKASEKEKMKNEKAAAKAVAKAEKAKKKEAATEQKERMKRQATINPEIYDRQLDRDRLMGQGEGGPKKKRKDRKFCSLPSKDSRGQRDPTWIRVYMEGVDEVVAHTTLFVPSETYEKLVGDTAARIEDWVNEDRSMRLMLQEGLEE